MKNNRGDIPITILTIGVFVVCTLALLSFFVSSINLRNSYVGVDKINEFNIDLEKSEFYNTGMINYQEINKTHVRLDYLLNGFEDELLFSVEYEKP